MKIGDLVRTDWPDETGDIGIVIHVYSSGKVDVLLDDGEYTMEKIDLEVINADE